MNIFVAGASGRVGQKLTDILSDQGHTVFAGTRNTESIRKTKSVESVHLDLHDDVDAIAQILKDADAVYFVAGSRGKDLLQTDLYGAVKLMQASEQSGIKRYIQLSSMYSLEPEQWNQDGLSKITNYNIAKHFSDKWLVQNTGLDYTILQPGSLLETPGSGKVELGVKDHSSNSIENVALVLAALLDKENTYKKVIMMGDGNTPIEEALNSI